MNPRLGAIVRYFSQGHVHAPAARFALLGDEGGRFVVLGIVIYDLACKPHLVGTSLIKRQVEASILKVNFQNIPCSCPCVSRGDRRERRRTLELWREPWPGSLPG